LIGIFGVDNLNGAVISFNETEVESLDGQSKRVKEVELISSQLTELFYRLLSSLCIEAAEYVRELGLIAG
jgi:hypothetical protein